MKVLLKKNVNMLTIWEVENAFLSKTQNQKLHRERLIEITSNLQLMFIKDDVNNTNKQRSHWNKYLQWLLFFKKLSISNLTKG